MNLDSAGYMIYAEAARPRNKRGLLTPPPRTALNRGMCKFVGSTFWTLFCLDYSFLSFAQRTAMLWTAWTTRKHRLTPDLARYSRIHASWLKNWFWLVWAKNLQFFILACVLWLGWRSESWTARQWVNNATDSATAARSIWIEKPTKHICRHHA